MKLDDDQALVTHVLILQHVKSKMAELKEMEVSSRAAIEEALGSDEAATIKGDTVIRWKHVKSNRLNQKALKAERPEIVAEYTEASDSRRFEVV